MIHVESAKTRSALTSLSSRAPSLMDVFCVPFERVMTAAKAAGYGVSVPYSVDDV